MNLAVRDIRHGLFRFVLTCFGLGLLMTVVLAMIGIYNGLVADALAVVKAPAADVWVVEAGTQGPFAEASSIPADTREAVARMAAASPARSHPARSDRTPAGRHHHRHHQIPAAQHAPRLPRAPSARKSAPDDPATVQAPVAARPRGR